MKPTLIYRPGKRLSEATADKRAPRTGKAPTAPVKVTVAFKSPVMPVTVLGVDKYQKNETIAVSSKSKAKAKRKPRGTFNRDAYQQLYMLDRRAAD